MKPIQGYPDYFICADGSVISYRRRRTPLKMNQSKIKGGYLQVKLYSAPYKAKQHLVHRLVAQYYIPNPNNLPEVHHIDGDKTNNHVSNLAWVDIPTNRSLRQYIYNKKKVEYIPTGQIFDNYHMAAKWHGSTPQNIYAYIKKGRLFRYC